MVKVEDFKTCNDSRFCKLHRQFADSATKASKADPQYYVKKDSVAFADNVLSARIVNSQKNIDLSLTATFLEQQIVRLRIQEAEPIKPRYQGCGEHVLKNGEAGLLNSSFSDYNLSIKNSTDGLTTHVLHFGKNSQNHDFTLLLTEKPWSLSILQNDKPTIEVNSLGYFNFENVKTHDSVSSVSPSNKISDATENTPLADNSTQTNTDVKHDETFKSWTDSVPNGPQSFGIDISFPGSSNLYGIPEHASTLSLKTTRGAKEHYSEPYRLYNLDVFEYLEDSPMALYGSVPLILSHSSQHTVGLFSMNSAETWVDITKNQPSNILNLLNKVVNRSNSASFSSSHWITESGVLDMFLIPGPTPKEVFSQYASLTGTTDLPREFALGYHQCRWNYLDQDDVLSVNQKFEEHRIPYDVIWLDIEHTDSKKYYTWDYKKFPDPVFMQNELAKHGRNLVNVVDPHIKTDPGYSISKTAAQNNHFIKNKNGKDFKGWCWPGDSNWVDYFNPESLQWVSEQYSFKNYHNTTSNLFIWNDMNEPAIFNGPEITMEKDIVHHGGIEHRDVHNIYGMLVQKSTFEGLSNRENPPKRPFVLSRAYFAGTQRYGAIWTGDNTADWNHLQVSIPMVLTNCLTGINFNGADVGGFFGNPSSELLTRWYQLGIWYPFFRAHAHIDTKRREPWLLGEPYVSHIRDAIQLRYRFLPYWYTLFYENKQTGMPIARPLWVEFPENSNFYETTTQFMVGSALMISPVLSEGDVVTQQIKLPSQESYYEFDTDYSVPGPETLTMQTPIDKQVIFAVGGNIIPTKDRPRRSSKLMKNDPYTINVFTSMRGEAKGSLYIDDGETFDYKKGAYIYREFSFTNATLYSKDATPKEHIDSDSQKAFIETIKDIRVERVVISKMYNSFTKAIITENGVQREVEVTCTSKNKTKCVIRDPAVLISNDWSIQLVF
ncbi:hypothetical protein BB561_000826 [Smittium simulii]|uniref:Glucosidase II subunit alpha n=1 Tax=Smittium simulii TaxID=133385 RepID=A0A2T9YXD9_9FUNG|nr:hypothetical protein BB561_000826 [Smittium simulii]